MYVGRNAYIEITDRDGARDLFAQNMERVEIETHSYCNRRCSYCPNVIGDRIGPNQRIASDIWEKILSDLSEIDYSKILALNYYNEPLADRAILDRVREARAALPNARIMIYSNGDYVEPGLIDELGEAGLSYLHISIHLKRGDVYSDVYVLNRLNEISVRMGLPARISTLKPGEYVIATAAHPTLEIEIRGIDFHQHGTDRGGLIDDISTAARRNASCIIPYSQFVVSFSGAIVPCCHIRADRTEHAPYVLGNLRDYDSIFQAFASEPAAAWRRELGSGLEKRAPCDTCAAGIHPNPKARESLEAIHRRLVLTPAVVAG